MHAEAEPISVYLKIFAALIVLTAITVGTAYVDFGVFNIIITIVIAGVKTALILLFFMHLRHSMNLVKIFAGAGFLWLVLLLGILMSDYLTRNWDTSTLGPSWITESPEHYLVPKGTGEPSK